MAQELVFHYRKSLDFLFMGLLSLALAFFLFSPIVLCRGYWNPQWFSYWWYWYTIPNLIGLALLVFGISQINFWINHIRKKPYLVITNDTIKIDAETDLKIADIASVKRMGFLGGKMLCLKIKNPQDYRFSWRFKADRLFHKEHHAFICPELIAPEEKQACLNWFKANCPQERA